MFDKMLNRYLPCTFYKKIEEGPGQEGLREKGGGGGGGGGEEGKGPPIQKTQHVCKSSFKIVRR